MAARTTFTYSIRTASGFRSKMEGKLRSPEQHGVASAALNGDLSDNINALSAADDMLSVLKSVEPWVLAREGSSDVDDVIVDAYRAAVASAEGRP